MSPDRIRALLFEIGAQLDKARSVTEFESLAAKYRALKNKWNDTTNNAILCYELSSNKRLDNLSDTINA